MFSELYPFERDNGFRMEGYHVWCGSAIRDEYGKYCLFASRWPKSTVFPEGYMTHSEIVLAVSDTPLGPYKFVKSVITKRDGDFWDSCMAHNPQVVKIRDLYYLFYIGNPDGEWNTRKIGYAVSPNLTDWQRMDFPLPLETNSNNPAVLVEDDGILMAYRDGKLRLKTVRFDFELKNFVMLNDDIFPGIATEDPFLYKNGERYEMVLEDNVGGLTGHVRFGARIVSDDAVSWEKAANVIAYDHTLRFSDGSVVNADRRERPQILFDDGDKYLFTAVLVGDEAYNVVQKFI